MESAEKCWRYADAKGGTEAEEGKTTPGSKGGSENGWIETRFSIEVMEICCWKERNRVERAKATAGSKAACRKMKFSRKQQEKWMERYEIGREVLEV